MGLSLYIFFSLTVCSILSLFSVLIVLMITCHGEVLFWSTLRFLKRVFSESLTWPHSFVCENVTDIGVLKFLVQFLLLIV
jgi:hypothetical protein